MVYLLKDLAHQTGYSIHTLKYYLRVGLIEAVGRSEETRYRYFDEQTVARLARIREWRRDSISLAEIARRLQGEGEADGLLSGSGAAG